MVRTLIGFACVAAGVLLAARGLYEVFHIGSCASGGPYISARPCPPGTGGHIAGLIGGIFLTLIGAAVTPGLAIKGVAWGLGFTLLGAAFIVAAFGPAAPVDPDDTSKWVGALVGGMFVLMGLPGLFAIAGAGKRPRMPAMPSGMMPSPALSTAPTAPAVMGMPGVVPVGPQPAPAASVPDDGDTIEELERLAKLKAAGALTEEEFQAAKARVLGT
ncbi:MAG: SHOCT domain-containing protein [Solirubrobacteraceae bacterium]|nr:SHOCT domain-containing protein [Solirubrobacteraceae bacterium]